ncbi:hypothetical protein M404DRAFT_807136 [Pisolithus tinctorius Marx 270]|uniref:Uncharacterized protein n=1 Tax=Pisolithus tinctorius Marx 270 TaxID=870435 RepID=A0A0C3JQ24_PISTI|nr:hypothetical protein M404DRAFT_807136 [Pisolithus tinctorius Marx 270]
MQRDTKVTNLGDCFSRELPQCSCLHRSSELLYRDRYQTVFLFTFLVTHVDVPEILFDFVFVSIDWTGSSSRTRTLHSAVTTDARAFMLHSIIAGLQGSACSTASPDD